MVKTRRTRRLRTASDRREISGHQSLTDGPSFAPPQWLTDAALLAENTSYDQTKRNQIVAARMYLLDVAYGDFEGKLLSQVHQTGFGSAFLSLLFTTGATAVSDLDAKTVLSAMATAVNGGRTAFSKEILSEQAVQTLIGFMQSRRAQLKAQLIDRMKLSYTDWPLGLALSDLQNYYRAGTLTGAFVAAAENAATERKAGDAEAARALASYDEVESQQATLARSISLCFARTADAQFDSIVDSAAAQNLLGLGDEGASTVKILKNQALRGATPTVPTANQKKIYLDLVGEGVGSEKDRGDRLTKHMTFVCKLVP